MTKNNRSKLLTAGPAAGAAQAQPGRVKNVFGKGPLHSGAVSYGNLLCVSCVGLYFEGDITAHTGNVLKEIDKRPKKAGSSSVFLNDVKDYAAMNEKAPVRTTVAPAGGIPGDSYEEFAHNRLATRGWAPRVPALFGSADGFGPADRGLCAFIEMDVIAFI